MNIPQQVIDGFNLGGDEFKINQHGNGLIHATYVVEKNETPVFILQRVNHLVFKKPEDIAFNLNLIGNHISANAPEYPFAGPLKTINGEDYVIVEGLYYRLIPFIKDTHTLDVCNTEEQAFCAARAFGKFTSILSGLDVEQLRPSIPGFHDLINRYSQFEQALKVGNSIRLESTKDVAAFLIDRNSIVDVYRSIQQDHSFTLRVAHCDTKINNVLFDKNDMDVCVIDLDTVMPGYLISDIGDMMRTYLSPANEEENDFSKISVRKPFIHAIIDGYSSAMGDKLSDKEKNAFIYAGKFMIYMQALRFYTDHLNNDVYYGARYEGHNLMRAQNQLKLLSELEAVESSFPTLFL